MGGKRLLAFSLVMLTVLAFIQPVGALLWPPVIGTCGFGGMFGPLSCGFPFGFGCPVPVPVPVPVAAPVPAAIPGPLCAPGFGFGGYGLGLPGPGPDGCGFNNLAIPGPC